MSNHLKSCMRKELESGKAEGRLRRGYHVVVEDAWGAAYWLHLAVREDTTFAHVDQFLRDIWLECCGHMSAFTIGNVQLVSSAPGFVGSADSDGSGEPDEYVEPEAEPAPEEPEEVDELDDYDDYDDEDELDDDEGLSAADLMRLMAGPGLRPRPEERTMDIAVGEMLKPKLELKHEYDFGSTTTLELRVVREVETAFGRQPIKLLARNDPPEIACGLCDKTAVRVCSECAYSEKRWLCQECADKHECGEEMLLPIPNSPRAGVCGYTGT